MKDLFQTIHPLVSTDSSGKKHKFGIRVSEPTLEGFKPFYSRHSFLVVASKTPFENAYKVPNYRFTVCKYDDGVVRIDHIDAGKNPDFMGKGITPAMIKWVANLFKCDIQSSAAEFRFKRILRERINKQAIRIWDKMVEKGEARFEKELGVYVYRYESKKADL